MLLTPEQRPQNNVQEPLKNAGAAKERANKTTFPKLPVVCHNHPSDKLQVQTDRSLATKGSITSPKGKKHPSRLLPWDDFPQ